MGPYGRACVRRGLYVVTSVTSISERWLITVVVRLVRTFLLHRDVGSLLVGQHAQLGVELFQLQARDLLVQVLRQRVDADRVVGRVGKQLDLGDGLVRERGAHHVR